jgi:hypothetical protein
MAVAVDRMPVTADARVQTQASACGIYGEQSGTGAGFSPSTGVPLSVIIPPMLRSRSSINDAVLYRKLTPSSNKTSPFLPSEKLTVPPLVRKIARILWNPKVRYIS